MNLFTLVATLGLDTTDFSKNVGKAVDEGKRMGEGLKKTLGVVTKVTGAVMIAGATAYISVVKKAADQTSELQQNLGGAEAVWERYSEQMTRIAQKASNRMGLSTNDFLSISNKMGSILQGSGFAERDALEMTTKAIQRAVDVGSIMGYTAEESSDFIISMLKGETQTMDNLGVVMTETALANYALEKGIKKSTSKMTDQEKTALRLQMFMEKTAYAAGNYAKENETLAGAMQTLKASWENFLDGTGDPEALADSVMSYINVYSGMIAEIAPRIWESFKIIAGNFGERISNWVEEQGGWGEALLVPVNWLLGEMGLPDAETLVTQFTTWWTENTMYDKIKQAANWTLGALDAAGIDIDWSSLFQNLLSKANVVSQTTNFTKNLWQQIIVPAATDIETIIQTWWNDTVVAKFDETMLYTWKGFKLPTWDAIKTSVETWWTNVKAELSKLLTINIRVGFGFGQTPEQQQYGETTYNRMNEAGAFDDGIWNPGFNEPGYSSSLPSINVTQNISAVPQSSREFANEMIWGLQNLRFRTS